MKANMGLLPELVEPIRSKAARYSAYAARARTDLRAYLDQMHVTPLAVEGARPNTT